MHSRELCITPLSSARLTRIIFGRACGKVSRKNRPVVRRQRRSQANCYVNWLVAQFYNLPHTDTHTQALPSPFFAGATLSRRAKRVFLESLLCSTRRAKRSLRQNDNVSERPQADMPASPRIYTHENRRVISHSAAAAARIMVGSAVCVYYTPTILQ